jgi:predicted TIM-barrel fold metal-dependent hydrolase
MIGKLPYRIYDCDTHVTEQEDAFTRYIEPKHRADAVTFRPGYLHDARLHGEPFDEGARIPEGKTVRPGSLKEYFATVSGATGATEYEYMSWQDWHLHRGARLKLMDEQNMEACIVFPNTAVYLDGVIKDDDVAYANLRAFNHWFDDEWGFNYQNRIYAPPFISLRNVERAVAEVEWALKRGARIFNMTTGHAFGRSPADPHFDPVWSRLNEANAVIAYHLTECGYNREISVNWSERGDAKFWEQSAWQWANCYCDRAIMDTLAALVLHNLFGRFPNLKVISVEHGIEWFPHLVNRLDKMRGMGRGGRWVGGPLMERPSEIVKRHIRVTPFAEDDVDAVAEALGGVESIVLGSDFPHAEGLEKPEEFARQLKTLSDAQIKKVMSDNGRDLMPGH